MSKTRITNTWITGLLVCLSMALTFCGVAGAATPAGTLISNQAVATYKDTANQDRQATSNIVYVTVQHVPAVDVTPSDPATIYVVAGQTVQYPFTVTNTSNGPDSYSASVSEPTPSGHIVDGTLKLYHDINGDGIIDAGDVAVTSVGPLAAGHSVGLIAQLQVKTIAEADDEMGIELRARSVADSSVEDLSGLITFRVATEGVVSATMQRDEAERAPGEQITYTINLLNQGYTEISEMKVGLQAPANTAFVAGSIKLNGIPMVSPPDSLPCELTISDLNSGQAYEISYAVTVNDGDPKAPAGWITNNATVQVTGKDKLSTNAVQVLVLQVAGVELAGNGGAYVVDPINVGSTYSFPYKVTNTGNAPDVINIDASIDNSWSVALYGSDGITPMPKTGTQHNVGALAAGASTSFVVKVTVPAAAPSDSATHTLTVTAKSATDGTKTDTQTTTLQNVQGAAVSIVVDTGDMASKSSNPGVAVEYKIQITNNSPITDLFQLSNTADYHGYTPGNFLVEYLDELGNPIADISVAAGGTKNVTVRVTVPASATPTSVPIDISVTATSGNNPSVDATVDLELSVDEVIGISLAPNRTGSANRGAFTTYELELRNLGNTQKDVELSTVLVGGGTPKLTYTFIDPNTTAAIGPIQTITLAVGASKTVKIRVDAPTSVAVNYMEAVKVTGTIGTVVEDSATLTTTITGGELQLTKSANVETQKPGDNIEYTVKAKNISVGTLTNVVIYEAIPTNTTFVSAAMVGATLSYSGDGGATWDDTKPATVTHVKWTLHNDLLSNAEATGTLTVKVK